MDVNRNTFFGDLTKDNIYAVGRRIQETLAGKKFIIAQFTEGSEKIDIYTGNRLTEDRFPEGVRVLHHSDGSKSLEINTTKVGIVGVSTTMRGDPADYVLFIGEKIYIHYKSLPYLSRISIVLEEDDD